MSKLASFEETCVGEHSFSKWRLVDIGALCQGVLSEFQFYCATSVGRSKNLKKRLAAFQALIAFSSELWPKEPLTELKKKCLAVNK